MCCGSGLFFLCVAFSCELQNGEFFSSFWEVWNCVFHSTIFCVELHSMFSGILTDLTHSIYWLAALSV